jgi:hypothetical protein
MLQAGESSITLVLVVCWRLDRDADFLADVVVAIDIAPGNS